MDKRPKITEAALHKIEDEILEAHETVREFLVKDYTFGDARRDDPTVLNLDERDLPDRYLPAEMLRDRLHSLLQGDEEAGKRVDSSGLAQIWSDKEAHKLLRHLYQEVFRELGGIVVVGEEATEEAWERWVALQKGKLYLQVDPVDGSSLYDTSGTSWSINASLCMRTGNRANGVMHDLQLLTVTTTSSGPSLVYRYPSGVYVAYGRRRRKITEFRYPADKVRFGTVQVVAAHGHQREGRAAALLDTRRRDWGIPPYSTGTREISNPALIVNTTGGAPSFLGYAIGRTETLVFPKSQTLHDTIGLLAIASLPRMENHFFLVGGEPIGRDEILRFCSVMARPNTPGYHPVPPLVISRNRDRGQLIAERMAELDDNAVLEVNGINDLPDRNDTERSDHRVSDEVGARGDHGDHEEGEEPR